MKPEGRWTIGSRIAAVLPVLISAGCGNLTTREFDIEKSKSGDNLGGVPFTLNKPHMTVLRTPGVDGSADTYAVTPSFLPDRGRRYVLKLDPSLLSSVDWTMSFDENGTLSETSATVTDQTPAIITSIGKLAVTAGTWSAMKPKVLVHGFDASSPPDPKADPLALVDRNMQRNFKSGSPQIYDVNSGKLVPLRTDLSAATSRWNEIAREIQTFRSYEQVKSAYTYRDIFDYRLLQTALLISQESVVTVPQPVREGLLSDDKLIKARAAEISDALVAFNRPKLMDIKSTTLKAGAKLYARFVTLPSLEADIESNRVILEMVNSALKAIPDEMNFVMDIVELDPVVWQNRRLASLNRNIATRLHLLRLEHSDPGKDRQLSELLRQRAFTLGVLPEFERRAALQKMIVTDSSGEPFRELAREVVYLDKQLADAEAALKGVKKDIKADDPQPALMLLKERNASIDATWLKKKLGKVRPPYVVIFEPDSQATEIGGK